MPYYPPPAVQATTTFSDAGNWAASTFYAKNTYFFAPTYSGKPTGERRLVTAPNGYTSGGSYGATDTAATISSGPDLGTLNTIFAPLGASYKFAIASSGDTVSLAIPIQSNGLTIASAVTVADLEIDLDYPAVGGTTVWRFSRWRYSDPSDTVIGSVTVADGKRSGLNGGSGLGAGVSLQAGDRILVRNTASNGTTFPGQGVTAYVSFNGLLPAMPNPSAAPTGLSVVVAGTSLTPTWTATTGIATGYLVFRDGLPLRPYGGTSYVDAGLGTSGAETHTYAVAAVSPGGISATTSGVSGTTSSSFTYYAGTGALDTVYNSVPDFKVTLGTNASTAATLITGGIVGTILRMTSGNNVGNAQDAVVVEWIRETGSAPGAIHTGWDREWAIGYGTSSPAYVTHFFDASAFVNLSTSSTAGLQLQITPNSYRFGFKAPTIASGAFQNLTTGTGPGTTYATKTAANGNVAYPSGSITNDGAHYIGIKLTMLPTNGDGTQTINFKVGTTAQLQAGTMTNDNIITLPATYRTALSAASSHGYHYWQLQGAITGTTAGNQQYYEQLLKITPLTAIGS